MTTVVVTGAWAGVGRAVVRRFARPGIRLALIARGRERLERAAGEVGDEHGAVSGSSRLCARRQDPERQALS